jgi:NAD(P)-dependent dehydrogenase (short-subunit alcohol dehydrogenase family)
MAEPSNSLLGKTALVSGAARRLGRALVLALAQQGVHVVIHYNTSLDEAKQVLQEIQAQGGVGWLMQADLSRAEQAETLLDRACAQAGPIDILINNASIFAEETLWESSSESLLTNMLIHAHAPLVLARALAAHGRPGHVINLLDSRVRDYDREHLPYHLSKRSLLSLTRILALEMAPKIAVNGIAPGLILPPAGQGQAYLERLAHTNPLNRYGGPQDIVDAMLFLLRSRFISGQIIYVDGGRHMKGQVYE